MSTLTTVISLINNPFVQIGSAAAFALLLALVGYFIRTEPKVAGVAQDLADLSEEVEVWVRQAEAGGLPGVTKYAIVLDRAQSWLAANGVTGRRGRLIQKYLPALIEATVKKVDPKLAPRKAA